MTPAYQVKGSTIRSKFEFVESNFGADARIRIEQKFEGKGLFPLLTASWYSYDTYVEVLHVMVEDHFDGDMRRLVDVGAASAKSALTSVYKAFARERGFAEFLEGIAQLHRLFYSKGRIEVQMHQGARSCDIHHRDKPGYADADLHVAAGFYSEAATLHGLSGISCNFKRDHAGVEFRLSWS